MGRSSWGTRMRARQDPRWSRSEPNAPLCPTATRGAARALGSCGQGAEPGGNPAARGAQSAAERRGHRTLPGRSPCLRGACSGRVGAHIWVGGWAPESRLQASIGVGRGWAGAPRGRHCPCSCRSSGLCTPGRASVALRRFTPRSSQTPKALLASLRQRCQGHRG